MSSVQESSQTGPGRPRAAVAARYVQDGAYVVVVEGELDLDTVEVLRAAFDDPERQGSVCTVADVSGVTFADSTALNVLLQVHADRDLRLASPSEGVRRLLRVSGADAVLRTYASVPEAVADTPPAPPIDPPV
ncbi:STAS domain-containing protein [Streptomyces sp. 549]|uniref:STAS domain-containing protein n=1 Tax=Streptomyces sp. 549 TaxID=3049076 RepID=UPI0024C3D59B|nr:STAS domain-containing protein [Streptomyces sp. 549]MDK1472221.1 STAS domain-containing protein [Streptomyces sp. 549]